MPQQEFTQWARSAQPRLVRAAYLLTGDHHRAEDLAQDALTKIALRWRRLRDGSPDAYARTVMYHAHISWWRKWRREVTADQVDAGSAPGTEPELRIVIREALLTLTPRQRAVVVLRYFEDCSERDAADALGVSVGTVKSQTSLALRRLRERAPELADLLREGRT